MFWQRYSGILGCMQQACLCNSSGQCPAGLTHGDSQREQHAGPGVGDQPFIPFRGENAFGAGALTPAFSGHSTRWSAHSKRPCLYLPEVVHGGGGLKQLEGSYGRPTLCSGRRARLAHGAVLHSGGGVENVCGALVGKEEWK